jgi:hypothetical protein
VLAGGAERRRAVRDGRDDLDPRAEAEEEDEGVAVDVRVLDEQDADRRVLGHSAATSSG